MATFWNIFNVLSLSVNLSVRMQLNYREKKVGIRENRSPENYNYVHTVLQEKKRLKREAGSTQRTPYVIAFRTHPELLTRTCLAEAHRQKRVHPVYNFSKSIISI